MCEFRFAMLLLLQAIRLAKIRRFVVWFVLTIGVVGWAQEAAERLIEDVMILPAFQGKGAQMKDFVFTAPALTPTNQARE